MKGTPGIYCIVLALPRASWLYLKPQSPKAPWNYLYSPRSS